MLRQLQQRIGWTFALVLAYSVPCFGAASFETTFENKPSQGEPLSIENVDGTQLLIGTTETISVTGTVELSTDAISSIVSESTVALKGAGGTTITSESVVGGEALHVINKGATNLEGLTFVYISTPNFQVGSTMTLTGLGNQTILQAFSGFCDFTIDSGSIIRVSTDTEREFPMAHLILNPDVHLSEKGEPSASTICTGFISGAN